jgi:hypothetical protein
LNAELFETLSNLLVYTISIVRLFILQKCLKSIVYDMWMPSNLLLSILILMWTSVQHITCIVGVLCKRHVKSAVCTMETSIMRGLRNFLLFSSVTRMALSGQDRITFVAFCQSGQDRIIYRCSTTMHA